jgi:hypothetical protein
VRKSPSVWLFANGALNVKGIVMTKLLVKLQSLPRCCVSLRDGLQPAPPGGPHRSVVTANVRQPIGCASWPVHTPVRHARLSPKKTVAGWRDPASQRRRHQIAPVEDLGHEPGFSSAAARNFLMSLEKTTHSEHGAEDYSRLVAPY